MASDPSTLRTGLPAGAHTREGPSGGPSPDQRRQRRRGDIAEAQGAPSGDRARTRTRAGAQSAPPRRRRKARMVHRVVRHVEVWSVAKVAAVYGACGYVIGMVSGYLLWRAADRVGTIDGIEGFIADNAAYTDFHIDGGVVFATVFFGGAILAVLFVALCVLAAVLFNLISDLTGGIRMTAIDEDLIVTPARRPEADPARRPPSSESTAEPAPQPPPSEEESANGDPWAT